MELIHIFCANATCPINQQYSSLEHERQIKKTFGLLKSTRTARARGKTLDCRLLGLEVGGANRDRTDDLLLAKQALSQLSYGPAPRRRPHQKRQILVGLARVAPATSPLSGVRSN